MRTLMKKTIFAGALLLPCLCAAQGTSGYTLNGPSLGLMVEPVSAAIRPILGMPGAATLGVPLSPGFPVDRAVVAPGGDFALALARTDFRLAAVRVGGGAAEWLAPATAEAPDLIAFSPRGSSAALYYRTSGRLVLLSGLRTRSPQVVTVDPASIPASPNQLAVSEDAASLLLALPEGDAAALYYLPVVRASAGFARRLGTFQSVSGLRFAGTSSDALLADGKANTVYVIQNVPGAAHISALGSARDGLSQPEAMDALDARRVLVVNAGAQGLTMLFRDGTPAASIQCGCTPAVLEQLSGNSVYRLTAPSQEPMWLFDGSGTETRILAVPPDPPQTRPARIRRGVQR